jgi:outer membrane immunogenic protein
MNRLNSSVALVALGFFFTAAPTFAADIVPPPEAYDWSGFHVGVGGGGNFAFVKEDSDSFVEAGDDFFNMKGDHSADLGRAGAFGTIEAGADLQLGSSFVVGVLANYDFGKETMKNKSNTVAFVEGDIPYEPGTYETKYEVGDSWAIGARAGFLAMDNALIYVLGGYTEAKIKSESELRGVDDASFLAFDTNDSSWEDGWFVGGGIEALLTQNISLKGEYRYNDYGSRHRNDSASDFLDVPAESFANSHQDIDVTVHSVRAVLSYRFGWF